jgi:translocation and assembly module TamB
MDGDMPTALPATAETVAEVPARSRKAQFAQGVARRLAILLAAGVALLLAALLVLDSSLGHRLVADRIAAFAPVRGCGSKLAGLTGRFMACRHCGTSGSVIPKAYS